jgi:hypothetical protein
VVVYPEKAPTSSTRSPEPEIARRRFGFEFWLTVGLFLFLAGMGWLPAVNHISLPGYPIPQ